MQQYHVFLFRIVSFAVIADIVPYEVVVQVFRRYSVEAVRKLIQTAVIAVDVLDMVDVLPVMAVAHDVDAAAFQADEAVLEAQFGGGIVQCRRLYDTSEHDTLELFLVIIREHVVVRHYGNQCGHKKLLLRFSIGGPSVSVPQPLVYYGEFHHTVVTKPFQFQRWAGKSTRRNRKKQKKDAGLSRRPLTCFLLLRLEGDQP